MHLFRFHVTLFGDLLTNLASQSKFISLVLMLLPGNKFNRSKS